MTGLYVASNPTALTAQFSLTNNMGALASTLTRLSTGLKINSGKDDPAGLIASELLKADITGTTKAITNTQRANSMISTADTAMGQIGNLLNDIKGLVVESANTGAMSANQILANQLQVDASLDAIDRIAKSTTYAGQNLLDGSLDFSTDITSGAASGVSNLAITSANFGNAEQINVAVDVQTAARRGTLIYNGTGVSQKTTINVTGSTGTQSFTFGAGTTNSTMASMINAQQDSTGVSARVEGLAARGSVVLSSAGNGNDIVITANQEGLNVGNYAFRIVSGATDDAKLVSTPNANSTGVVEITLAKSYERTYSNFANLFDVTVNTGGSTSASAVSITRGNEDRAYLNTTGTVANAARITAGSTELTSVTAVTAGADGDTAKLNGWTFVVGSVTAGAAAASYDTTNKVATLSSTATSAAGLQAALNIAVTTITGATAAGSSAATVGAGNLAVGNSFVLASQTAATGQSADGLKTITVQNVVGPNAAMSNLNGWTVNMAAISAGATAGTVYDYDAKTVSISATSSANAVTAMGVAAQQITGATAAATMASTGTFVTGDTVKLGGGAATNELVVTYKSGTTAQTVVDLMNTVTGVTAGLKSGVSGTSLVPDVLAAPTRVAAVSSLASATTSNATAQQVIELINNKLGNMFLATGQSTAGISEGTNQKVSFMNASATYGDINLDNALRFTGMDSGPIVRMVTTDVNGNSIANQKLSVTLINPSEADIAAGAKTPILQINLATDASGKSISTAADIANLFDSLTPAQTGGISAEVLTPSGVDPNGRTWVTDECGVVSVFTDCAAQFGLGLVQPTGVVGTCDITQNDIVLLGANQTVQSTNATAKIAGLDAPGARNAIAVSSGTTNALTLTFANTSAMNGVGFKFTADAAQAGFDATNGNLTVYIDSATLAKTAADLVRGTQAQLNGQISENWAAISAYTGATGGPVTGTIANTGGGNAAAITTELLTNHGVASTAATFRIPGSTDNAAPGTAGSQRGVGPTDAALVISANSAGTDMAGVKVVFQKDTSLAAPTGQTLSVSLLGEGAIPVALTFTGGTDGNLALLQGWNIIVTEGTAGIVTDATNKTITLTAAATSDVSLLNTALRGMTGSTTLTAALDVVPDTGESSGFRLGVGTTTTNMVSDYDATTGVLTIRANADELSAFDVARDLNANAGFASQFTARTNITTSGAATEANTGSIGFNTNMTPAAEFTGGYRIVSARNLGAGQTATSAGILMTGQSDSNERLVLTATEVGSDNFVKVSVKEGTFDTYCPLGLRMNELAGTDVVATINGIAASAKGNNISINTANLAMSMDVAGTVGNSSFAITGGGALFQLGSNVVSSQQMRVGIGSMMTTDLGGRSGNLFQLKTGGSADLVASDNSRKLADLIVNQAISTVANTRGRLGAIQKSSLDPNISVLQDSLVALTEANGLISNADFAEESSNLTRLQLLVQAGMSTLGIANQFPQYAASLIR